MVIETSGIDDGTSYSWCVEISFDTTVGSEHGGVTGNIGNSDTPLVTQV